MRFFNRLVVINAGMGTARAFAQLTEKVMNYSRSMKLEKGDLLLFEGGVDISPELYGEGMGSHTQRPNNDRDNIEGEAFFRAKKEGISMVGICRGAQLFTALLGGRLIQHVNNHGHGDHPIMMKGGGELETTSVHHQMMYPWEIKDHEILAYSPQFSSLYLDDQDQPVEFPAKARLANGILKEPEVVWYPDAKALAIQGHPEYVALSDPFATYCRRLTRELCGDLKAA